jgi:hypothetical protein
MTEKDAYREVENGTISFVGTWGIGKSSILNLVKEIQVKEKLLYHEVNKSSDNFGSWKKVYQQHLTLLLFFDTFEEIDTLTEANRHADTVKGYSQENFPFFYYDNHSSTFAIKPSDKSDLERACQTYQTISTRWCTFEPFTNIFLQSVLPLIYDSMVFEEEVNLIFPQILWQQLAQYNLALAYSISVLRRRNAQTIRLQYIANQAHNRVSRSPAPQKKEPPVGGVKVGGEQYNFSRYVATMLYLKQKRRETSPTSSTGKYANYGREGPGLFHLKGHAKWPKTSFRQKMKAQVRSLMSREKIKTQTKSLLSRNKIMHKLSTIQTNLILRG